MVRRMSRTCPCLEGPLLSSSCSFLSCPILEFRNEFRKEGMREGLCSSSIHRLVQEEEQVAQKVGVNQL